MKHLISFCVLVSCIFGLSAKNEVKVKSPDGKIEINLLTQPTLGFEVTYESNKIFEIPTVTLTTDNSEIIGQHPKISGIKYSSTDEMIESPFYRSTEIHDNYNSCVFNVARNWDMAVRVYNDAVAYRWIYKGKKPITIKSEGIEYAFNANDTVLAPYVPLNGKTIEEQLFHCFENTYTRTTAENLNQEKLVMLPMVVEVSDGIKVGLTESALENYPGFYILGTDSGNLKGYLPAYPKKEEQGGYDNLQSVVTEREDFIAKIDGSRSLPWRVAVIAPTDLVFAQSNISYLLGEPSRVDDISWIKPGKVAWEWWNNWNLGGVDFETGVNNDTYKAYIDFASRNGIEYVILDEGWNVGGKADLMLVVPEIDIQELVDYGAERGVGIILWAGHYAFDRNMEDVVKHYADMGVKGFKVDIMNRDDQKVIDFNYRAAKTAAKNKLLLDLHGTSKPAGLNRTYPNVLNFEGVVGLEHMKWAPDTLDMMKYDTQIPFIRQLAGPMDYTQGAMMNVVKKNYRPSGSEPMSQGTRTHQLALYLIFDSPLAMLSDTPSNYDKEQESVDFITEIPTVWDETKVLDGKLGEYIVTARRKGNTWWIGAISNWDPRDIEIDLSMLPEGNHNAVIFTDGVNAHRRARDYKRTEQTVNKDTKLKIHLAPGGGAAMKID